MEKINLTEALRKLEEINDWFESQQEIDVENGLEKVKEGVKLVKASRGRLQEIENEFEEVKKELVHHNGRVDPTEIRPKKEIETEVEEIPF